MNAVHQIPFTDRSQAGRFLGQRLAGFQLSNPLVLALPKGGLPVASELARFLGAQVEALVAVKLHSPKGRTLGALCEGGGLALDQRLVDDLNLSQADLNRCIADDRRLLERRLAYYRPDHHLPDLNGRNVILVDDFVDSGWTALAAIGRIRLEQPARLLLAVPVAQAQALKYLEGKVDAVMALHRPQQFGDAEEWFESLA